jgi:hypothetical protein
MNCYSQEYDTEWQSIPFSLKSTLQPSDANLNQSNQPLQLNVKSTINLKDLPCWHYISDYDTAETVTILFSLFLFQVKMVTINKLFFFVDSQKGIRKG